jgi:ABC-type branched-subunit amino acid transport system ATPase component
MSGGNGRPAPLLEIERLSKNFGGVQALDAVSFFVGEGEILGLIGPNGSGKTTSFNMVTGIYKPSGGRVGFGGRDITGLSPQAVYRAGIARTFQRSRLCLPLSIFDNIMIGNHARLNQGVVFNLLRRRRFHQQFEAAFEQARALVRTFSAGLGDRMFEPVGALPMIERRRIEICRALNSRPRLLLLDEPSAGMTHEETRQLMDDILDVRRRIDGLSVVIIEHEMGVIERITDHCVVLNYGRKICEGSYREIAADREVQEAYLGVE